MERKCPVADQAPGHGKNFGSHENIHNDILSTISVHMKCIYKLDSMICLFGHVILLQEADKYYVKWYNPSPRWINRTKALFNFLSFLITEVAQLGFGNTSSGKTAISYIFKTNWSCWLSGNSRLQGINSFKIEICRVAYHEIIHLQMLCCFCL